MKKSRQIPAGEFKAKCLKLMDEVAATGEELIITKRGKPVAKLSPADSARPSLLGCTKGSITILGDIVEPIDAGWEEVIEHWDELQEDMRRDKDKPGRQEE